MPHPEPLAPSSEHLAQIQSRLEKAGIEFVRFEQSDTHGVSRSKTVPTRHFQHFASHGLNFLLGHLGFDVQSGVAPGSGYLEDLGFPDSRLFPDLDTFTLVPWADLAASVLCEPRFQDGTPAMAAPRAIARGLLRELENMGYGFYSGFEYEFYLVDRETRQPPFQGIQIFTTLRNNFDPNIVDQILLMMPQVGVDIITSNSEYGPGQMEINFAPAGGITAADHAFRFKNGVKEIAQKNGYMASFMTKPYADQSANGCHYHHSLVDLSSGTNAFSNVDRPFELNDVCRWWLGGQIKHAAAICAFAAPTINCYKRYKQWSFAPTNATWGTENRTVGVRVKGLKGEGAHLENRTPCGSSNPYLVMAAILAAGMDGLKQKIEPPAPVETIAYGLEGVENLPPGLTEALDALETDMTLRDLLGEEFIKLYLAVKRHEINKAAQNGAIANAKGFLDMVTPFEVSEYFEFL
ncbi:MAG: glutamine synthetase [Anaerolineae bacterium]|nr:glutamine synthetase [Anaerolineae bacterium]MCA9910651.1 glutamine synthetase [Anaerolineae bacterium]